MSRLSLLTAGLLILFAIFQGYVKHQARTQRLVYDENESFASFTRPTVQGRSVHLDSVVHNHTVVWVTFWASWCGPCKVEMSMLADLYEKHHDQGFAVVAVNVREDSTTVRSFLEKHSQPYPVVLDSTGALADKLRIKALPTSFLLNEEGKIIDSGTGVKRDWFERHVAEKL
jgi:thiol-disulfide isomerase/thioredoxin